VKVDASAARIQILATEHWSLLATRSMTYSESFSRVSMFLAVLSGAIISLALLAQVDSLHQAFNAAAVLILSIVIFVGAATVGRLSTLNREDARWVMGMNRLRRAYLEMYPELEPYFITDSHDDQRGTMLTLGLSVPGKPSIAEALHGFQTLPAMVAVIVSVVAAVWAALIATWLGLPTLDAQVIGVAVFIAATALMSVLARRNFMKYATEHTPAFPSEPT
jgi:hypothetical protein